MFCIYCGATLPEGAEVCPVCGNQAFVGNAVQPAAVPEAAAEPVSLQAAGPDGTELPKENDAAADVPVFDANEIYSDSAAQPAVQPPVMQPMEDLYSGEAPVYQDGYTQEIPQMIQPYEDEYVYEEYEESMPKKRSFKWLFILLPILVVMIAVTAVVLTWYNAPMQQLSRALDEDNYSKVTQLLPQLTEEELSSVQDYMKTYAEEMVNRYNQGEVEYNAAYELVERLQRIFPDVIELDDAVQRMKALKDSKEAFAEAKRQESSGKTENILRLYGSVIPEDTYYAAAQEQIAAVKAAYKASVLEEAQSLADQKDFLGAQSVLENSQSILGEDADITAKMDELKEAETEDYVTTLLETAQKMADEEDFLGAIRLLEEATKKDKRFAEQIEVFRQGYKEKMMADAAALAEQSEYEEAVAVLRTAQSNLGEDSDIAAKIEEYKAMYPVLLVDLSHTGGSDCDEGWMATDSNGNTYSNGLSFALYPIVSQTVYTEYSPDGKYKRLSGTWVVESDSTDGFVGTVRVYVDGSLQYEVSALTLDSQPVDLNLRIDGAQTVRIEVEGAFTSLRETGYVYLAGATFRN